MEQWLTQVIFTNTISSIMFGRSDMRHGKSVAGEDFLTRLEQTQKIFLKRFSVKHLLFWLLRTKAEFFFWKREKHVNGAD